MEDKEDVNIKDLLQDIKDTLKTKDEKKIKAFKIPFGARLSSSRVKKGFVTVAYISQNKGISFFKVQVDEGVYKDKNGIPHVATAKYILNYKNKPMIIQPEWSQVPFNPEEHLEETLQTKNSSTGWKLLANHFEKEQIKPKGSFGAMGWIFVVLVLIGLGYYAWSNGYLT